MKRHCFHLAAHYGHVKLVKHLVHQHGMDVNDNSSKMTPLHWSAKEGQVETVTALLELGASPDTAANEIKPLALAIGGQHVDTARVLIQHNRHAPFDVGLLPLARSPAMKNLLVETFKMWKIALYLPTQK